MTQTSKNNIKRLFFDIETSPNVVWSWNIGYKLNIDYKSIIHERAIICICYKWEGESKVHSLKWNNGDDKKMIHDFFKIITDADEVIGHNGDNFDIKWFKTRAIFHGIRKMPKFKSIDTLKISRKNFRFNSNKLDYIGQYLGLGKKVSTGGFDLWKAIINDNNRLAMAKMIKYCANDVVLLEKVYNKLEGYEDRKSHTGIFKGNSACSCPSCGSEHTISNGHIISNSGFKKKKMQCMKCGSYFNVSIKAYESRTK